MKIQKSFVWLFPKFSASNFFKWAHDCGATCVNMLGAVAEYLYASKPSEYDQKHKIRIMLGSPAPRNLEDFQKRFNVRVIDGYGSTEMGMVLWKNPEDVLLIVRLRCVLSELFPEEDISLRSIGIDLQ